MAPTTQSMVVETAVVIAVVPVVVVFFQVGVSVAAVVQHKRLVVVGTAAVVAA
jgi:hypothetical protein